jgi:hypothetical protein
MTSADAKTLTVTGFFAGSGYLLVIIVCLRKIYQVVLSEVTNRARTILDSYERSWKMDIDLFRGRKNAASSEEISSQSLASSIESEKLSIRLESRIYRIQGDLTKMDQVNEDMIERVELLRNSMDRIGDRLDQEEDR